ncbi:MAG: hypothetical protein GX029_02400 [Pseudomonadaceae bacterium]|nr:hypothetical protein [Pseudomonadaceae bacterium]
MSLKNYLPNRFNLIITWREFMLDNFIRKEIISQISPNTKKNDISIVFKTSNAGAKIKFDTEIITVIKDFLSKKITPQHKNTFRYALEGGIDSKNQLDSSILVIYMQENSDYDMESIYLCAKKLIRKCLNNLIEISNNHSGNVHKVKILSASQKVTASPDIFIADSEDEILLTQSLIYNVLSRSKNNCTIFFKIDEEYFDLNLVRSINPKMESKEKIQISCIVISVDDHYGVIAVKGADIKGIKKYQFDPQHRRQLLEAQLAGDELIIDVTPMEKFSQGELVECGGLIKNIKVVEYEKLI